MTSLNELFDKSMRSIDVEKAKAKIDQLSKRQLARMFDEAYATVHREKVLLEYLLFRGETMGDKTPKELNVIGMAFLTIAEGSIRGLKLKKSVAEKVERELVTLAAETGAEYAGKLAFIDTQKPLH